MSIVLVGIIMYNRELSGDGDTFKVTATTDG